MFKIHKEEVEINGKLYQAYVTDKPLYDANGEKMRMWFF